VLTNKGGIYHGIYGFRGIWYIPGIYFRYQKTTTPSGAVEVELNLNLVA
jgi:hypothetical protein